MFRISPSAWTSVPASRPQTRLPSPVFTAAKANHRHVIRCRVFNPVASAGFVQHQLVLPDCIGFRLNGFRAVKQLNFWSAGLSAVHFPYHSSGNFTKVEVEQGFPVLWQFADIRGAGQTDHTFGSRLKTLHRWSDHNRSGGDFSCFSFSIHACAGTEAVCCHWPHSASLISHHR